MNSVFQFLLLVLSYGSIHMQNLEAGRIAEFDEVLMKYSHNIASAKNMKNVIKHLEMTEGQIMTADHVMVQYYYEVCEGIAKSGDSHIVSERSRLNDILSGVREGTPDAVETIEYAHSRRNILEAFIDAQAEAVMEQFNMKHDNILAVDGQQIEQQIKNNKIKITQSGNKVINLDNIKVVKVDKDKKPLHDEM